MRLRLSALTLAALACVFAAPAHAQNALDRADARCILMLSVQYNDPKTADAAKQGTFYFLGRLAAHGMSTRLQDLIGSEARSLEAQPPNRLNAEIQRCAAELTQRSNEYQVAFRNLKAADAAAQKMIIKPVSK